MELLRGIAFNGLFTGGTGKQQVAPFFSTDKDEDAAALFTKEDEERGRQLQLLVVVLDDHGTICRRQ